MYKYCLYGKERNIDTGCHPISLHVTRFGARLAWLFALKTYKNLTIKP